MDIHQIICRICNFLPLN